MYMNECVVYIDDEIYGNPSIFCEDISNAMALNFFFLKILFTTFNRGQVNYRQALHRDIS